MGTKLMTYFYDDPNTAMRVEVHGARITGLHNLVSWTE
jgi:hypothetical protein